MFPFPYETSPFNKIFSCVIKQSSLHWQELLRHFAVPYRLGTTTWRYVPNLSMPPRFLFRLLHYTSVFSWNTCRLFSSSKMHETIELLRISEQVYDVSNKYSDSVWKEKLWWQIGEKLKNSGKSLMFYCPVWNCCHSVMTKVLIINIAENRFRGSGRIRLITYVNRISPILSIL